LKQAFAKGFTQIMAAHSTELDQSLMKKAIDLQWINAEMRLSSEFLPGMLPCDEKLFCGDLCKLNQASRMKAGHSHSVCSTHCSTVCSRHTNPARHKGCLLKHNHDFPSEHRCEDCCMKPVYCRNDHDPKRLCKLDKDHHNDHTECEVQISRNCGQCNLSFAANCGNPTSHCGCTRTKVAVFKRQVGNQCLTGDNHNKFKPEERTQHTLTVECGDNEFLENFSSIQLGDLGEIAEGQTITLMNWDNSPTDLARGPTKVSMHFYGGSRPHNRTIAARVMHWKYQYHWPAHLNRPDEIRDQ